MILAATGHRPDKLGGYAPNITRATRAYALACLYEHRPDRVISGMALGWDQAVADAALTLGIPLTAAIPFWGQEIRWPQESRAQYEALMERADVIHAVTDAGNDEITNIAGAMQKRNEWMVDRCDFLIALWNGSNGGTANCIRYAKRVGCPLQNVWDAFWVNNIPF